MEVEIARKVSKNHSMFRAVMERVCGIRFYALEISTNDWDKDDCFVWKDYKEEYTFNENKEVVMNAYNNIQ